MKVNRTNKLINLNYIINNSVETIKEYLKYNGTNFNDDDIDVLINFVNIMSRVAEKRVLQNFVVGYKINRLDKEFDLIKMDDNNIINIELKETYADLEQAIENYKVLKVFYSNCNIHIFCYCKENNNIYSLNNEIKTFEQCNIDLINQKLQDIIVPKMIDIDFKVYSIYKNPNFFIENEFCLSKCQKDTFDNIMHNLDSKMIIIQGDAGVGKSLLALFVHKELLNNITSRYLAPIKVYDIIDRNLIKTYNISTVKEFINSDDVPDYIIIDEAQNLSKIYIDILKQKCKKSIIMFGDRLQDIKNIGCFDTLCSKDSNNKVFNMKKIIRTNNTFVVYAKKVLNIDTGKKYDIDPTKIEIKMSDDTINLSEYVYIEPLKSIYYEKCTNNNECNHKKCIKFTNCSAIKKSLKDIDTCSLEYDKVAIYLCDSYKLFLDENGKKIIMPTKKSTIQYFRNELYLMMTRAITNLLIITDNLEVYNYLMAKKEEL